MFLIAPLYFKMPSDADLKRRHIIYSYFFGFSTILLSLNLYSKYSKSLLTFIYIVLCCLSKAYKAFSLKYKISVIWLVEAAFIFLILLTATVQISMECETQESYTWYAEHLNLQYLKHTYVGKGQIKVLNLESVSINKILVRKLLLWKFHRI